MNVLAEVWIALGYISGVTMIDPDELTEGIRQLDPPHRAMTRKAVEAILTALNKTETSDDQVGAHHEG